jgi:micrococcal nuclease
MKRTIKMVPVLVILFFLFPTISFADQFRVTRVYDGDTIKAEGNGTEVKVRLVGIDAPETSEEKRELRQPYSEKAKRYLADLILNKIVAIKDYGLEGYDVYLGVIFLNRKNINLEMIRAGLAEAHLWRPIVGLDLKPFFEAEKEARADRKGMWLQGDSYVSPSTWRKADTLKSAFALILYGLCGATGHK